MSKKEKNKDDEKSYGEKIDDNIWSSFNIKFKNTEQNWRVHKAFSKFCKEETQDNYLLGLKKLLENYSSDWKYNSLYDKIERLKVQVESLKHKILTQTSDSKKSESKTFGKSEDEVDEE